MAVEVFDDAALVPAHAELDAVACYRLHVRHAQNLAWVLEGWQPLLRLLRGACRYHTPKPRRGRYNGVTVKVAGEVQADARPVLKSYALVDDYRRAAFAG